MPSLLIFTGELFLPRKGRTRKPLIVYERMSPTRELNNEPIARGIIIITHLLI
jgi:hypothetical protein